MQTFASIVVPPVSTRCGLQYGLQWRNAGNRERVTAGEETAFWRRQSATGTEHRGTPP